MTDLRMFKDEIAEMVKKVNRHNKEYQLRYWPWTVRVLKNEVRLTNGYIKDMYDQDYFRIVYVHYLDSDSVYAADVFGEKFEFFFPGDKHWEDGSLMNCIRKALHEVDYRFRNRF